MKIYVLGGNNHYADWIPGYEIVKNMEWAELVIGVGGSDWSPHYYNEPKGTHTRCNEFTDAEEWAAFEKAVELKKPLLGICKSAQGLCVFAGGRLIQHQADNYFAHPMQTFDRRMLTVTSSHHQAQYPYDMPESDFKLLGWTNGLSDYHLDGENKEINLAPFREAEVVYYPKMKAIGFQGHPEFREQREHPETNEWLLELINKLLTGTL